MTVDGDVNGDRRADVTISGDSDQDGKGDTGLFRMTGSTAELTLKSLTLTKGDTTKGPHDAFDAGGAISAYFGGKLLISDCAITKCKATVGGGIYAQNADVTIINSTISDNKTTQSQGSGSGGGIYFAGIPNTLILTNTTVFGNDAPYNGGGILVGEGHSVISNSTIVGNTAWTLTGGIFIDSDASAIIQNSIIANNVEKQNTTASDNFAGVTSSIQNSVLWDASSFIDLGGNVLAFDLGLGPLQDNGGTVETLGPKHGSVVIGVGSNDALPPDVLDFDGDGNTSEPIPVDARDGPRIAGDTVDAGAVEFDGFTYFVGDGQSNVLTGNAESNKLLGRAGNDTLDGKSGHDLLKGEGGDDTLVGTNGDDTLNGGVGNDTLNGGAGKDVLWAAQGADTFVFQNELDLTKNRTTTDRLVALGSGADKIDLSQIDADSTSGDDNTFHFVGTAAFSGIAGELRAFETPRGWIVVEGDTDGDGSADLVILLVRTAAVIDTDFVL